jgi:uncharacterized protein YbjQ (UPF0145 family)
MPKTRRKGGGAHVSYFKTDVISADPNNSPEYKSIGIITTTAIKGINVVRKFGTNLINGFGQNGFELPIYEELRKEVIAKLLAEMPRQGIDRISSLRIEYTETPSHLVANCYGTALKSIKK